MNSTQPVFQRRIKRILFFISTMLTCSFVNAQAVIKGKILGAKDAKPVAFASIKLLNYNSGSVSDASGNFSLAVKRVKQTDTLLISSVGFENLKIPAQKAMQLSAFTLIESQKTMDAVVIRSFKKEEIAGAQSEIVGYSRSWNTDNTGGEIGRSFLPGHKEYQIAKVRFKVYNTYDTCTIRLHIREMISGKPSREIVSDSIAQIFTKSPGGEKPYEFDLTKYNVILKEQDIFVSFEVLGGSSVDKTQRSLTFIGSEEGKYFYKSKLDESWSSFEDYTIYMKLLLRYDDE